MTQAVAEHRGGWIRWCQPRPDAPYRLVCLPHAGGAASSFLPLAAALGATIEVLAIQYPGRQDRIEDPMIDSISAMADELCHALLPWIRPPFALFGHSMGALAAFELAQRLEAAGRMPLELFASGAGAPVPRPDRRLREMGEAGLMAELRRLTGAGPKAGPSRELLRRTLPVIRNDIAAVETYAPRPGARLSCPVTALIGDADPAVTLDDARAWATFTKNSFDMEVFPGGHFYLVKQRHNVAKAVNRRLAAAALPSHLGPSRAN